ncbi:Puromycin-sensitive aminopeptidase [Hordeum vulgare]|nr:Puromycin-sensitive aminopeptidase [Hordeum vulgare]
MPAGPVGACRSPPPVVNASTGPNAQEQQGSSQPATEHPDGHTATPSLVRASGSASHARLEMPHGRHALAMAIELLRYQPAPDRHNDWLQRIEELVSAAGDSTSLSCSFRPQLSQANDEEQDAPPPPPRRDVCPEPRQEAHPRGRPCEAMIRSVLDDTYALCMAGKQKVVTLMHLIVAYKDETEYIVLAHAINALLF